VKVIDPDAEQTENVPRRASARLRLGCRKAEPGRELRDVQDRSRRAVEDERRDDRTSGRLPAAGPLAGVADVQRLEGDAVLAKELLGRDARGSGRLPEERQTLHRSSLVDPV
jgi:hypothetical protein